MSSYTIQPVVVPRPPQEQSSHQEIIEEQYDIDDPRLYTAGSHTPVLYGDHKTQGG